MTKLVVTLVMEAGRIGILLRILPPCQAHWKFKNIFLYLGMSETSLKGDGGLEGCSHIIHNNIGTCLKEGLETAKKTNLSSR